MPNFLDRLKVKTPSYNIFQYPVVENKLDMQIGRNYPVKWLELHAGEECDITMTQLTRFMPMTNPIFHKVDIEFIPFFVPFRLLEEFGWPARDYFNPATPDSERPAIPTISINNLYAGIDGIIGSIWDYLRYPTFAYLLRELMNNDSGFFKIYSYNEDDPTTYGSVSWTYNNLFDSAPTTEAADENTNGAYILSPADKYDFYVNVYRFYPWVYNQYLHAIGNTTDLDKEDEILDFNDWKDGVTFWDDVYNATGKRQDDLMFLYLSYLHQSLFNYFSAAHTLDSVSLLPWLCYTRLIYDWFINTNLTDISEFPEYMLDLLSGISGGNSFAASLYYTGFYSDHPEWSYFFPFAPSSISSYVGRVAFSLWQRDYFTGAFPSSQSDSAVPIPANGTIPDLANARKLQWFRTLNLFGGKRFIDQIFAHRGVKSSDARLDRCEVIGDKKVWNLEISDVLQTSQSTIDSPQGDFAGHGISYGGDHLCHYRAEEPGLVMVIGRVRPKNSYMEVVPKLIYKTDFYDFENPEFDNVGMQPIMQHELQSGYASGANNVFGWTRRYMEYMTDTDEYHGHFTTSLMNWHLGRSFNSGRPLLNTVFSVIKSDGSDELNRIFANPGYRFNVLSRLRFDIQVSRPLSKVIEFDF